MTSKSILRRVAALESAIRAPVTPTKPLLAMWLVAFHVGQWKPHESAAEAGMRALGYEDSWAYTEALRHDLDGFNQRYRAALVRMFAAHGVDFDSAPREDIHLVMCRLIEEADKGGMRLPEIG